jgi:PAS domain S-box-containing protein
VPIEADALIPLLGALPDAVLIATTDGRIIATNATLCTLTGYSSEELRDASLEMLIPNRMRARHVALRSAYSSEGGTRSISDRTDIVLLRADGVEVPVDVALCSIPQGDETVVVATVRDASKQRLADQVAQRERAFLNALNDVSTALLDEGNVDDTLRLLTRRARAVLDADLAVLVLPAADDEDTLVVHVADGLAASELLGSPLPSSDSMTELTMRNREPVLIADGSNDPRLSHPPAWPAEMGATLIIPLHARGKTVGCMTIARHRDRPMFTASDITFMTTFAEKATLAITFAKAQHLAEREAGLRIAAVRSEREVALQHEMVEQLEALAKAKTDFVAKISHELRTPLTSVIGYVEILLEGCQPEADGEQNRILHIVDRNSHRLLLLIEALLTVSLIETGGFELHLGSVDLGAVVDRVRKTTAPAIELAQLELRVDLATELQLYADGKELERALFNLVDNAIKFTAPGGLVEIALGAGDEQVAISVRDTGCGIPIGEQPHVFMRFFRSIRAQEQAVPGTGLGLYIADQIVGLHGGTLEVVSTDHGSVFTMHLPVGGPSTIASPTNALEMSRRVELLTHSARALATTGRSG